MSNDVVQQFEQAMRDKGLGSSEPIVADGERHRFSPEGDKRGSNAGWYILHLDFPPSGAFGTWKDGVTHKWTHNPGRELTEDEKSELRKRVDADRKRKQREEHEARLKAADNAGKIWKSNDVADDSHPYLQRKGITAHGTRRAPDGSLIVPVVNQSKLVGLQFIPAETKDANGEDTFKRFISGTPIEGSYYNIGEPIDGDEIIICEGFATAATINEATGLAVIIAFNAGNLVNVGKVWRERLPSSKFIFAADNDQWTTKPVVNPGVHFAGKAAAEVKGEIRRPFFRPGYEGRPTDFNDVGRLYGHDEVRRQIRLEGNNVTALPAAPISEAAQTQVISRQIGYADSVFFQPLPHQMEGKKPLATVENLQEILYRIGATVRYNVILKDAEILIAGRTYSLDNNANAVRADVLDACSRFQMPTGNLDAFLLRLADLNQYNPVAEWIGSKPWDGKSRLAEFFATITAVGEKENPIAKELKNVLIRKWLISAVAAAFSPYGISAHGVLVFQGAQYLGKTAWFKRLAPQDMRVIADGLTLDPRDKDSVAGVIQHWIVELGELDATFRKADIAQLKSFITKDRDILRMPYAPKAAKYPRRTVFFASVNPREFLADPTGNRRFWTIACEDINHKHEIDVQQVWAEVHDLWKQGEGFFLDQMEMQELNSHNESFTTQDPIEEKIMAAYDWTKTGDDNRDWKTASEILKDCGIERPSRHDLITAASAVRKLNGGKDKRTGTKKMLQVPKRSGFQPV